MTGVQTCALPIRSEEHTSELQSHDKLVCRLLLEKNLIAHRACPRHRLRDSVVGGAAGPPWRGGRRGGHRRAADRPEREGCPNASVFFFNDTATTEICTLSLHDALPICSACTVARRTPLSTARRMWGRSSLSTRDRKSTRLNSSHTIISYAVFCLKK